MGSISANGVWAGLIGTGVGSHNSGSATPPLCAKTLDFLDVKMVGPKMVAAPATAPILSISLLVNFDFFSLSLALLFLACFLGIESPFIPCNGRLIEESSTVD
jgi:hypothetical protein